VWDSVVGALSTITPGFIRRHYAAKFLVAIVLVMGLISVVGMWGINETKSVTKDNSKEQFVSTAYLQAQAIGDWVQSMRVQTRMVSSSPELQNLAEQGRTNEYLREAKESSSTEVVNIHYVNPRTNKINASTRQAYRGRLLRNVPVDWTAAVEKSRLDLTSPEVVHMSNTTYNIKGGEEVMAFVTPVPDSDNVLVVIGSIERRSKQFSSVSRDLSMTLVDTAGTVVFTPRQDMNTARAYYGTPAFREAMHNQTIQTETRDARVVTYAPVEHAEWAVILAAPKGQIYRISTTVMNSVMAIAATAAISVLILGYMLGRHTIRPIVRLQQKTKQMEKGDLDVDLSTDRTDELGNLYEAFESMRTALQKRIIETRQARIDAEETREDAEQMAQYLEQKADEYGSIMDQCASGDLTLRMNPDGHNEEMDEIAEHFNDMMDKMEKTIRQLKHFSEEVSETGELVLENSQDMNEASEQIAASIQDIAQDTQVKRQRMQEIATTMSDIAHSLEEYAEETEGMNIRDDIPELDDDIDEDDLDVDTAFAHFHSLAEELEELATRGDDMLAESKNVTEAAREQDQRIHQVTDSVEDLVRYTKPLKELLWKYQTTSGRYAFSEHPASDGGSEANDDD
jgi:methyl-accepting chemotaxis protein